MIKTFCNICEVEITADNEVSQNAGLLSELSKPGKPTLHVQVLLGNGGQHEDEHFCKHCVIDAVKKADDRPRDECEVRYEQK